MKDNNKFKIIAALALVVASILLPRLGFIQDVFRQHETVTVNLTKVMAAESFMLHRGVNNEMGDAWKSHVKTVNSKLKDTIELVAGKGATVLVAPAVIVGGKDITDDVLKELGLPVNIPDKFYQKKIASAESKAVPAWLLP